MLKRAFPKRIAAAISFPPPSLFFCPIVSFNFGPGDVFSLCVCVCYIKHIIMCEYRRRRWQSAQIYHYQVLLLYAILIFFSRRIMFIAFDHAFFTTHAREKFNFDEKKVKTHIFCDSKRIYVQCVPIILYFIIYTICMRIL